MSLDNPRFLMRVAGLGAVKALFLTAEDERKALDDAYEIYTLRDRRIINYVPYKIKRIELDPPLIGAQRATEYTVYLQTGILDTNTKAVMNDFFHAQGDTEAYWHACNRRWGENKLYRCDFPDSIK